MPGIRRDCFPAAGGWTAKALNSLADPPDNLDGKLALEELVSCKDLYHEEPSSLASYDFNKVKVLHTDLRPRELSGMVPRFVRGIVDRFDTMVEKSRSEIALEEPCRIKPYWDPILRNSKKEKIKLVIGLARKGLVSFRTSIKEEIGVFCVKKKTPEWVRLIIDARRVNASHRPPPTTRLATPRSFLDVQFKRPWGTLCLWFGG